MRIRQAVAFAAIALGFLSLVPADAVADGVYIPPDAYPAMPKIPVQRAMIVYRDGMETLVVESTMDTEALDVGWILPLPAEPTKLDVADGGMLTSLAFCLRPAITHDLHDFWVYAILVLGFLVPIMLFAICSKEGVSVFTVVCWFLIYILLLGVLVPAGMHAGGEGPATATVLVRSTQRVGDYNVSVLRAGDAQALSQWLADNGLRALDENASAVVGDYIARGWCFAVARLAREKGGEATPHPMAETFPAERPVYPMKLTSLADSITRVELYIVADRRAAAKGFHCALADRFAPDSRGYPEDLSPAKWGKNTGVGVGNPDILEQMWDGCVLTRLQAGLVPEAMDRDVAIELTEFRPHRDHYFSPRGRSQLAVAILLWGAVPIVLVAAVVCYKRRRPSRRGARVLIVVVGVTLVAAGAAYLSAPVIAVGPSVEFMEGEMRAHNMGEVATLMVRQGNLHAGMTPAEMLDAFENGVKSMLDVPLTDGGRIANIFTGEPMHYERSPGNFSTRTVGDKTYFCLYDKYAREIRAVELPPPTKPEGAENPGENE
jgi:hypothetical protein